MKNEIIKRQRVKSATLTDARVEHNENGYLTYFKGYRYPVWGIPTDEGLWAAEQLKKFLASILYFLSKPTPGNLVRQFSRYCEGVVTMYFEEERLSPAVREIYRVLKPHCKNKDWVNILQAICVWLEQDKAYRHRLQDLAMAANVRNLIHRTYFEANRLFSVYLKRVGADYPNEYRFNALGMKLIVRIVLLSPKLRRGIRVVAKEVRIQRLYLDRYDVYWALQEKGYDYDDKSYEERLDIVEKL